MYLFRIFVNCGGETEAKLLKNWSQILTTGHNNRKNYVLPRKTSSIYRASGQKRRYLALIDCSFYGMMLNRTFVITKSVGMMFNITLYFIETFSRN